MTAKEDIATIRAAAKALNDFAIAAERARVALERLTGGLQLSVELDTLNDFVSISDVDGIRRTLERAGAKAAARRACA